MDPLPFILAVSHAQPFSKAYDHNYEHLSCRLLNCFSPNINLVRDPRWGRNSETYGEDPHLTAELAKAFVTGLQGNDSRYIKVQSAQYCNCSGRDVHSGTKCALSCLAFVCIITSQ